MSDDNRPVDMSGWSLPVLLRAGWAAYRSAIRRALDQAGYGDLPLNGPSVLGAVAGTGAPLSAVIVQLGMSKQSTGQLVDTLVRSGYLDRSVDPHDRRRLVVGVTEQGAAAADVIRSAAEAVDAELEAKVGARRVADTRAVLAALSSGSAGGG